MVCLGLPLLLGGCARPPALVFLEPAFWDASGGGEGMGKAVHREASAKGFRTRVLVAQTKGNPSEQLAKILSADRIPTVVLGPLLSFEGTRLANAFPETRFILVGGPSGEDAAPNTVQLLFDRRDAFRRAGSAAALSAADASAGAVGKVGLLRMIPAGAGDPDGDAFREAVEKVSGTDSVTVRELPETADRPQARRAVEEMRAVGVELFLLRAGSMAPFLLETLRDLGGAAIVEDWQSSRYMPRQVFLSVEEDLPAGIGLCLPKDSGNAGVRFGPVRIVWGEARKIPASMQETAAHVGH
jgi:basic membrane lipoprotein Med (substrate-binding protein (PBP1-ABC) superfamily)